MTKSVNNLWLDEVSVTLLYTIFLDVREKSMQLFNKLQTHQSYLKERKML